MNPEQNNDEEITQKIESVDDEINKITKENQPKKRMNNQL